MNIYIDESGIFANPQGMDVNISCVAGLIINESKQHSIFYDYENLLKFWGSENKEVKGSSLDEEQVAQVIDLLINYDALLEISVIDLGMHTKDEITNHRFEQLKKFSECVTVKHSKASIQYINDVQQFLGSLSTQLYTQSILTNRLIHRILTTSTLYFSLRSPEEMENFYWFLDAKDLRITPYEEYWEKTLSLYLQSISIQTPLIQVETGDYKYFQRYYMSTISEYLSEILPKTDSGNYLNANLILTEHLSFDNSGKNIGLQLVDILANTFRRALKNNLQISGWGKLGKLMVNQGQDTISFFSLKGNRGIHTITVPYANTIKHFISNSKPLWLIT